MSIHLKGIAWDHPRGYEPLRGLSKDFKDLHPNVEISWDVRSLKEFGDMPIEHLIEKYDLITIDHPYMGQADNNQLLIDLKTFLTKAELTTFEKSFVGPSYNSYLYKDSLYALPIDAAALVAANREDLFLELGLKLPTTQDELINFYKAIPKGYSVAWPLCSVDIWCSFLTMCAQEGGRDFIQDYHIDETIGSKVIDQIKFHLEHVHPNSINWNPIQVLDHMANNDDIIYAPYLFGYTNYSREQFAQNTVIFQDSPTNPKHNVSTILGGVGLAISANCKEPEMAVNYAKYVANASVQKENYYKHQGQPASISAWESAENNTDCNDFFKNTRNTLEKAYVRPQHANWNEFQEKGSCLIHEGIVKNQSADQLIKDLNNLYKTITLNG